MTGTKSGYPAVLVRLDAVDEVTLGAFMSDIMQSSKRSD